MRLKLSACILIFACCSTSFARPFPSSGKNLNCSLQVYKISKFVPCSYGPKCPVIEAQAQTTFQKLEGNLDEHVSGAAPVTGVRGLREANGGAVSEETLELVKIIKQAELEINLDYKYPKFSAALHSKSDPTNYNLLLIRNVDLRKGTRPLGPSSDTEFLAPFDSDTGIYGELTCGPSLVR